MTNRGVASRGALMALALVVIPSRARAQDDIPADQVQRCATAYEQAQIDRNAGRLKQAQGQLQICLQDACPDFLKRDCVQWLGEVAAEIPTIIFAAKDTNKLDLVDVKVLAGDSSLVESLDGRPVELDPGHYDLTFEYRGQRIEHQIVVSQGERNRVIRVTFEANPSAEPTGVDRDGDGVADAADACPDESGLAEHNGCHVPDPPPKESSVNGLRIGAYAGWGVGLVAFGGAGFFRYKTGKAEDEGLEQCARRSDGTLPDCSNAKRKSLQAEADKMALYTNIGLGVGIAGAVVGTGLFVWSLNTGDRAESSAGTLRLAVSPLSGGSLFSLDGSF